MCQKCNKKYICSKLLLNHLKYVHGFGKGDVYKCCWAKCPAKFCDAFSFRRHLNSHECNNYVSKLDCLLKNLILYECSISLGNFKCKQRW